MKNKDLIDFVIESNKIERIFREPLQSEIDELDRFINLKEMSVAELEQFVKIYQPDARLRDDYGLNVRVGKYYPVFGNPDMRIWLNNLLVANHDSFSLHIAYEKLHPFTDGNGRSGRALWAWKSKDISGGFLVNFYFETLHYYQKAK